MKNEFGFSLIEVLVAIVIFAIGILAIGRMQISAIQGNSFSSDLTTAITLAQDRIESLMNMSYDDPNSPGNVNYALNDRDGDGTAGLDDIAANADHSDPNNPINGKYNIYWNIATNDPINNTKTIRVIVSWKNHGSQRKAFVTTMKTDI